MTATDGTLLARCRSIAVQTDAGFPIISGVDIELHEGQILAIVGESGSGKTTAGMTFLGYVRHGARLVEGEVEVEGRPLVGLSDVAIRTLRGKTAAYVPQDPMSALNPMYKLGHQVDEVLQIHTELDRDERRARTIRLFEDVGLPDPAALCDRYPHEISGGQQQRVLIAVALACDPSVLVFDEPTTGLDVRTQARILDLIANLPATRKVGIVYISHDLMCVNLVATHVAVMYGGEFVETGTRDQVIREPRHPYTRALLAAAPTVIDRRIPLHGIPGSGVGAAGLVDQCRFADRCLYARKECRRGHPALEAVSEAGVSGGSHSSGLPAAVLESDRSAATRVRRVRCIRQAELPPFEPSDDIAESTPRDRPPILVARDLSLSHTARRASATRWAATGISFALGRGEKLALVGESGSGKTTLARSIAGLHPFLTGELTYDGEPLAPLARKRSRAQRRGIQFIHQNPESYLNPRLTIRKSLLAALTLVDTGRSGAEERVEGILSDVQLRPGILDRFPADLSGGEKQRVAIARALLAGPDVLICDEITSALDVSVQASILDLLESLREEHDLSVLFITHDMGVVRSFCDRLVVLKDGRLVEEGTVSDVFADPAHQYTKDLLDAVPTLD